MKSTFFFFVFLISISISMRTEARIDSREFQEIIDDFVEINKEATSEVDVGMLLAGLKITLDSSQNQYSSFLDSFIVTCNNAKFKLANYVLSLKTSADDSKNKANHWKKSAEKAFSDSGQNDLMLKNTRLNLNSVIKEMARIIVEYHQGVSQSDKQLTVIKQLNDIIEDELIKPTGRSFVQLKFHRKLADLQDMVRKSGDTLYTPIIAILIGFASEQNFSKQNLLKQILLNIHKLKANIEKFKGEKEGSMNSKMMMVKTQEENLESQIGDYQHLSERYVSIVTEAHQNMALLNTDFSNLQSEIGRKNTELETLNKLCEEENTMYKKGIDRIVLIKEGITEALVLDQQRK